MREQVVVALDEEVTSLSERALTVTEWSVGRPRISVIAGVTAAETAPAGVGVAAALVGVDAPPPHAESPSDSSTRKTATRFMPSVGPYPRVKG